MLRSSPTSTSRYHVEKLNLKSTVAKNLRDAMESLIGDLSSFADILLESNDGIRLAVHSCILKCRAPQFYTNHIAATFESKADNYCSPLPRVVPISEMDFNCMSKYVHKIYTDDTAIDDSVIDSRHSGATTFTIDSETYLLNSDPNGNQLDNNTVEDETELADSDLLLEESSNVECQSCINEQEQIRSSVKDNIQVTPKSDNRNSEHSLIDCTNEQQQQVISFKATDPCSALGTDLLCMFLTGQGVDCTIRSRSAQFNVHKCILSAVSSYFSTLFSDQWQNSSECKLPEISSFSNEAVSFMLMFIYGGVLEIPDSVDLIELYRLADITQLNALKTLVVLELRAKRCHYFHKPCSQCATFVLRHLSQFNEEEGLQELYEAALDWQAEHFADIWRSKSFSQLPEHVQNACYERILDQVNSESALQLLLDCDALLKRSRTLVAAVSTKVARISEHCLERIGNNFADILASDYFIHLGKGFAFDLPFFEDLLPTVIHSLQLEEACRVLAKLAELKALVSSQISSNDETWNERFLHFLKRLYELCDSRLIHHASQVVNCHNWALLSHDMQERIRETGIFVDFKQPNNAARQKVLASLQARRHRSTSRDVATNGRTDETTSCKPKFPLAKAVSHPRNNFQPSARLVPVGRKVNNLHKQQQQQQQQQKKRFVKSCDALNTERTLLVVGDDELWLPLSESTENKPTTPKTKLAKQLPPANNIPQNARIVKSPKSRSTIRH